MKQNYILDCTLRDGGYCNEWNFGKVRIKKIIDGLVSTGIDIIECGFLNDKISFDENITKYSDVAQTQEFIGEKDKDKLYVLMMNYGEYDIAHLPMYDGSSIDGIRVAFHKQKAAEALEVCKVIKEKGYKVFVQPMVSMSYSDQDFISLIMQVNEIDPFAFYIVDSFGVMKKNDLIRLYYLTENNLNKEILIGYHSHNNMQLSYSNAQAFLDTKSSHRLILDSSVYGMGRGAGNLNTELITEYLNDNFQQKYKLGPLLGIIDGILNHFYINSPWGYSLPNYLSAKHNAHPNYAQYLDDRNTLTIENMDDIFESMDDLKKNNYDEEYVKQLYFQYLNNDEATLFLELEQIFKNKKVLVIAPGKSSKEEKETIIGFAERDDIISVSVNFVYDYYMTDYVFVSNIRRFREMNHESDRNLIVTSNVKGEFQALRVNYKSILNDVEPVRDNAALMLINLLIKSGAESIYLAGMDGYSLDIDSNYVDESMDNISNYKICNSINNGITKVLDQYAQKVKLEFVTKEHYVKQRLV